jgi:peptidoglycan biosynthesis protein MviN/MurJ (putative lipid II flippase)
VNYFAAFLFAVLLFSAVRQLITDKGRIKPFTYSSVPIAIILFWIVAVLIWFDFAPASLQDTNRFALIGVAETFVAVVTLVYAVFSMRRS